MEKSKMYSTLSDFVLLAIKYRLCRACVYDTIMPFYHLYNRVPLQWQSLHIDLRKQIGILDPQISFKPLIKPSSYQQLYYDESLLTLTYNICDSFFMNPVML